MSDEKKSPEPEAEEDKQPEPEEQGEKTAPGEEQEPLPPLDIYGLLRYCIGLLHGHAWRSLGLIVNPATKEASKDLGQAKVAIDCVAFMMEQLEGEVDDQERKQFQNLLSDLRVNFVQQSKPAEATEPGDPASDA